MDEILDAQEDQGAKAPGEQRGDDPRRGDLRDPGSPTRPSVVSVTSSSGASEAAANTYDAFFHSQLTWSCAAMPTPTRAPMMECVVETGKPYLVATATKDPAPNSAQTMARISVPGLSRKRDTEKTPLRTVLVTPAPSASDPVVRCGESPLSARAVKKRVGAGVGFKAGERGTGHGSRVTRRSGTKAFSATMPSRGRTDGFRHRRQDAGLDQGQRPGGDRGRVRVRDIVGAVGPSAQAADRDDVSHGDFSVAVAANASCHLQEYGAECEEPVEGWSQHASAPSFVRRGRQVPSSVPWSVSGILGGGVSKAMGGGVPTLCSRDVAPQAVWQAVWLPFRHP